MEMTIEERYTNACIKYLQKNMECINFRDYIIERLSKFEQIEQIVSDNNNDGMIGRLVREVVNGRDNN